MKDRTFEELSARRAELMVIRQAWLDARPEAAAIASELALREQQASDDEMVRTLGAETVKRLAQRVEVQTVFAAGSVHKLP